MTIKEKLYTIIFESDTKSGKNFDVVLLWLILTSVVVTMLDSVKTIGDHYINTFYIIEWILTVLFSLEYILRIIISRYTFKYLFSFWGIIDFLSVVPTYIGLFYVGFHYLMVVRIFRLLRVFRVLKLVRFNKESLSLLSALKTSSYKIGVFFSAVLAIVVLLGTIMYVVEGAENGFTSIPQCMYWAIITITTVGYGDIVPHTIIGKLISSVTMIMGYAIIAVPTGIITVEMSKKSKEEIKCKNCNEGLSSNSNFCSNCGSEIQ